MVETAIKRDHHEITKPHPKPSRRNRRYASPCNIGQRVAVIGHRNIGQGPPCRAPCSRQTRAPKDSEPKPAQVAKLLGALANLISLVAFSLIAL